MNDPISLYLDLMKKSLTYYLWGESISHVNQASVLPFKNSFLVNKVLNYLERNNLEIVLKFNYDPVVRAEGRDWPPPPLADTMIGLKRLDNLQLCIENIIKNNILGDVIETGVWRGGGAIFMRAVLKAHGVTDKVVWVADSFEGLSVPNVEKYPHDIGDIHHMFDILAVPLETVKENFARYGLLDEQVRFLKGWFKDTLPGVPVEKFSIIRLDGDMYESTMDALRNLFPKLSVGGYVIIDDYVIKGCKEAVHDYRLKLNITDKIIDIDGTGAYWQRTK